MEAAEALTGRALEAERALTAVRRGANVLVRGRAGVGKSTFLEHLYRQLAEDSQRVLWLPAGTTKTVLLELARQIHEIRGLSVPPNILPPRILARARRDGTLPWRDLSRTVRRLPIAETTDIVATGLEAGRFVVFIDSLEVPPSQAELFGQVIDRAQVVAAMDDENRRVRIDRLLWRFQERIEVRPLPLEASEEVVRGHLAHAAVRFPDSATRDRFVRHVARESAGVPAAIVGMVDAAEQEGEITPAKAREWTHDAGARYLDMTPAVVVAVVVGAAMRYIGRGFGATDIYVLSGILTALLAGIRFFMWRMRQ